jgi:hypothetical protein
MLTIPREGEPTSVQKGNTSVKRKLDIQPSQLIATGANQAGIHSAALATYLVKDNADALADMRTLFGNVALDQISISQDGIVIIDTDQFRAFVKNAIANPVVPVGGYLCSNQQCLT